MNLRIFFSCRGTLGLSFTKIGLVNFEIDVKQYFMILMLLYYVLILTQLEEARIVRKSFLNFLPVTCLINCQFRFCYVDSSSPAVIEALAVSRAVERLQILLKCGINGPIIIHLYSI